MMKRLVFLLVVAFIFANGEEAKSDVIDVTDSTADFSSGDWLVEFYAPWCGHCKHLAPTWEKVATSSKGKVKVAKVDCTKETELCSAFSIRGYPTIKFISKAKGGAYEYSGQRTESDLISFATGEFDLANAKEIPKINRVEPATTSENSDVFILTDTNFDVSTAKGTWLVEFYAPWCGHCKHLTPVWEELATALKGRVNVGKLDCTTETVVAKQFSIKGYPTIRLIKDGKIREYKGARTVEDFTKYVDGGFESVDASPIPGKPGFWDDIKDELGYLEKELKNKIWIALALVFVAGLTLGKFIFGGYTIVEKKVIVRSQSEADEINENEDHED